MILAAVILALGAYVLNKNSRYLSDFNITSVMFACAALGFISLGQTFALLLGGIDLSVGPLAGLLVVVASFFVLDGKSPAIWVLGFALMLLARGRRRARERRAHPLREVHARSRRRSSRTSRWAASPSRCAMRPTATSPRR